MARRSANATDAELVELAFDFCHGMVFAISNRITGSQWEAEDVTQTVFEEFARRLKTVRDPARIPGFLKTLAVRTSLRLVKRGRWRRQQAAMIHAFDEDRTRSNEQLMAASVRELLGHLEPEERTALILKFVEMHSHDEVALLMAVSVSTARRRIEAGRKKLGEIAGDAVVETIFGRMRRNL